MSVSPGQNEVKLDETTLTGDLSWSTEYSWKILAYESGDILKYTTPAWSFTTIQEGPLLGDVTPGDQAVHPGEEAVFSLTMSSKADTFQWYKEGDPDDIELSDTDPNYSGVKEDTLTINDVQLDDAGFYYCIGKETATALTDQSTSGELWIKELKTYYPFETTYVDGVDTYTPDIISGKDMQLMGIGTSLAGSDPNIEPNLPGQGQHLLLVNPNGATNQWARIIDNTVANYEDITIACWVYPQTLVNENDRDRWNRVWDFGLDNTEAFFLTMLYRQDDPRQDGWDVSRSEWNWYTMEGDPPASVRHNQELDVESEIDPKQWYYMVVTVEDGYGRIYLNGECGTEDESPQGLPLRSPIEFTKTFNYIGRAVGATVPYFNGRIDEFKIYNYALTSEEIAEEYSKVTGVESICDRLVYDLYDWDYDLNCKVDLGDFAEIAARWLDNYRIFPE